MDRQAIFQRDNFTCQKCGFHDKTGEELESHHITPKVFLGKDNQENFVTLCSICHKYAPDSDKEFQKYVQEKIDSELLETFRKSDYSISKKTKQGMNNSFNKGLHLSKPPKGYKLVNKELVVDEEQAKQVKKLFEEFANTQISLTQLAKKNNLTTSGVKKLLQNTTYLGKVKFADKESLGQHPPIISETLFEQVQTKLKSI